MDKAPPSATTSTTSSPQPKARRHLLCSGSHHHCFSPEEKNVFSEPYTAPSQAPSVSPAPTSFRFENASCDSDGRGDYGNTNAPNSHAVEYRYQVETTSVITATFLNIEVLQDVEKKISDLLVKRFFSEVCSPTIMVDLFTQRSSALKNGINSPYKDEEEESEGGVHRSLQSGEESNNNNEQLLGLSAAPVDQVLPGDQGRKFLFETLSRCFLDIQDGSAVPSSTHLATNVSTFFILSAGACPFPGTTDDSSCYVVGGGLTTFLGAATANGGDLSWIDEGIFEEIQQAMDSGDIEREIQQEHRGVLSIRYIPPGTPLPDNANGLDEGTISAKTPAWSWVLIGFGVFLLAAVFAYMVISRRNRRRHQEENEAAVVGAFPIAISPRQIVVSEQGSYSAVDGYGEIAKQQSTSADRMDLNIRGNSSSPNRGGIIDDDNPLHVFDDDEPSPRYPREVSTGWRQLLIPSSGGSPRSARGDRSPFGGTFISMDPNQPFVRPHLNDEDMNGYYTEPTNHTRYHSAQSEEYDSGSFSGSSPSHSDTSSPSKLTISFERGEMI